MKSLAGRHAIVCGSTQGIGKACAEALARDGAAVTLVARHRGGLEQVRDSLPTDVGQEHDYVQADFHEPYELAERIAAHVEKNPADILINNSGGPPAGQAIAASVEEFEKAFKQHLVCNQLLVQCAAPYMRDTGYGRIVNIISTSVITPIKGLGVSNTIRGAVGNWGRTLAAELGPFGITVNNVLPGFTATARLTALLTGRAEREGSTLAEVEARIKSIIPANRFADPTEIADVVAFLASPAAGYVNGVNLPVDGGRVAAS